MTLGVAQREELVQKGKKCTGTKKPSQASGRAESTRQVVKRTNKVSEGE
jgi:hypothetical protein